MNEAGVLDALRHNPSPWHPRRGWFLLPKVRCSTGYGDIRHFSDIKTRAIRHKTEIATVDALAMNAWESQNHRIEGIEIKLSRGDWLREKRDPLKTEVMRRNCDALYVVAPAGVVRLDLDKEIGASWGYVEITPGELDGMFFRRVVECPPLPGSADGMIPRSFLMSILRNIVRSETGDQQPKEEQ